MAVQVFARALATTFVIACACAPASAFASPRASASHGWTRVRHGANFYSECPDEDLRAARDYGIRLARLGATGDQNDFRYLVGQDGDWDLSPAKLERLKRSVRRFGRFGMDVVITLSHVPGRSWAAGKHDVRIFQDPALQTAFFAAWKIIASALANEPNLAGYDLLNEPILPPEEARRHTAINYAAMGAEIRATPADINEFYRRGIAAIREVDVATPIIVEATATGDFEAMELLRASSDPRVLYSFHYYEPYRYYRGKGLDARLVYPGSASIDGHAWDFARHRANFARVERWRVAQGIPASRIYIGEFGVGADALGATSYLRDLTNLFGQLGWSWTYYAFREDAFPHADLELAGNRQSRARTGLFELLRRQFR